jgi:hypothetical protein
VESARCNAPSQHTMCVGDSAPFRSWTTVDDSRCVWICGERRLVVHGIVNSMAEAERAPTARVPSAYLSYHSNMQRNAPKIAIPGSHTACKHSQASATCKLMAATGRPYCFREAIGDTPTENSLDRCQQKVYSHNGSIMPQHSIKPPTTKTIPISSMFPHVSFCFWTALLHMSKTRSSATSTWLRGYSPKCQTKRTKD